MKLPAHIQRKEKSSVNTPGHPEPSPSQTGFVLAQLPVHNVPLLEAVVANGQKEKGRIPAKSQSDWSKPCDRKCLLAAVRLQNCT